VLKEEHVLVDERVVFPQLELPGGVFGVLFADVEKARARAADQLVQHGRLLLF
jgi:hypothetical protein